MGRPSSVKIFGCETLFRDIYETAWTRLCQGSHGETPKAAEYPRPEAAGSDAAVSRLPLEAARAYGVVARTIAVLPARRDAGSFTRRSNSMVTCDVVINKDVGTVPIEPRLQCPRPSSKLRPT
jgi:hypothetical protein